MIGWDAKLWRVLVSTQHVGNMKQVPKQQGVSAGRRAGGRETFIAKEAHARSSFVSCHFVTPNPLDPHSLLGGTYRQANESFDKQNTMSCKTGWGISMGIIFKETRESKWKQVIGRSTRLFFRNRFLSPDLMMFTTNCRSYEEKRWCLTALWRGKVPRHLNMLIEFRDLCNHTSKYLQLFFCSLSKLH